MFTVDKLRQLFPKHKKNCALTGYIPMDFFNEFESHIRRAARAERAIVIYRGPRISNNCKGAPSNTMRCDATYAVLYRGN